MRGKVFGSTFEFFEQSLDAVPISVCDVLKSEALLEERGLEPRCTIDEKHSVGDVVFLLEFVEKLLGENDRSGGKELDVQEFVRVGIDRGVQPKPFVVELNHRFIDRNVIRIFLICGL
jgi:hypothetical protein